MNLEQAKNLAHSLSLFDWSNGVVHEPTKEGYSLVGFISKRDVGNLRGMPNPTELAEALLVILERVENLEMRIRDQKPQLDALRRIQGTVEDLKRRERVPLPVL